MNKRILIALALSAAGVAQAQQQPGPSFSIGLRAWNTQWDTFSYDANAGGDPIVTQSPAEDKLVLLPVLSMRWRDFTGSVSLYPSNEHDFVNGARGTRKEFDLNVGYFVIPTVALTLGYKKIEQADGPTTYALSGPVIGVSGTAPLASDLALYGSFGMGRLKSTSSSTVKFDADYRLSELGVAYTLPMATFVKAITFTAGYRTQVLTSKEALGNQDGRDLTQGFTFGALASF